MELFEPLDGGHIEYEPQGNYTTYIDGTIATLICDFGYIADGNISSICQPNGWSVLNLGPCKKIFVNNSNIFKNKKRSILLKRFKRNNKPNFQESGNNLSEHNFLINSTEFIATNNSNQKTITASTIKNNNINLKTTFLPKSSMTTTFKPTIIATSNVYKKQSDLKITEQYNKNNNYLKSVAINSTKIEELKHTTSYPKGINTDTINEKTNISKNIKNLTDVYKEISLKNLTDKKSIMDYLRYNCNKLKIDESLLTFKNITEENNDNQFTTQKFKENKATTKIFLKHGNKSQKTNNSQATNINLKAAQQKNEQTNLHPLELLPLFNKTNGYKTTTTFLLTTNLMTTKNPLILYNQTNEPLKRHILDVLNSTEIFNVTKQLKENLNELNQTYGFVKKDIIKTRNILDQTNEISNFINQTELQTKLEAAVNCYENLEIILNNIQKTLEFLNANSSTFANFLHKINSSIEAVSKDVHKLSHSVQLNNNTFLAETNKQNIENLEKSNVKPNIIGKTIETVPSLDETIKHERKNFADDNTHPQIYNFHNNTFADDLNPEDIIKKDNPKIQLQHFIGEQTNSSPQNILNNDLYQQYQQQQQISNKINTEFSNQINPQISNPFNQQQEITNNPQVENHYAMLQYMQKQVELGKFSEEEFKREYKNFLAANSPLGFSLSSVQTK